MGAISFTINGNFYSTDVESNTPLRMFFRMVSN
jgi:hypothetical protein